jgi:2'-5' RNA ligase
VSTSDLFPESLEPEKFGFNALPLVAACSFALRLDEETLDRIVEQQCEQCARIGLPASKWRPRPLLHSTIAEWGAGKRLRAPLDAALHDAKARFHHSVFDAALVQTARFNGQNGEFALVLESDAATARRVNELRNALADAQRPAGLIAKRSEIRPHVTLGYGLRIPDETVQIPPIRFRARHVDLIISQPGTGTHHLLDRWELKDVCGL